MQSIISFGIIILIVLILVWGYLNSFKIKRKPVPKKEDVNDDVEEIDKENSTIGRSSIVMYIVIIATFIVYLGLLLYALYAYDSDYLYLTYIIVCIVSPIIVAFVDYSFNKKIIKKAKKRKKILIITVVVVLAIEVLNFVTLHITMDISSKRAVDTAKPIIYLYPEEDTEVAVTLGYPDSITASYPTYVIGWNVLAKTDGTLIDLDTGRSLYSLYYESESQVNFKIESEGFIVKKEDTAEFLEEKLEILGLNEREAEEFIIYWLPVLQENEYNYIRFANEEEIEENMPLTISPEPDTLIRVLMTYKGLDEEIEVEEQDLESVQRSGFVAVEWGGTEIK